MSKLSEYTGEYTLAQRDPVALPQLVKDGIIILFSGLVVFDALTLNADQMAWVLIFAGFVSAFVALWSRAHAFPAEKVYNEFIDAETGREVPTTGADEEAVGEYGVVPVVHVKDE